ncbi:MAG TPA: hypothetical protein VKB59_05280 [Micromonosporaceae bacterium]|nr:hypothetical protein [Micromonosporaceae bacterium]
MATRIRLPREDHRRWGMPTIWVILAVILGTVCVGCCVGLKHIGLALF